MLNNINKKKKNILIIHGWESSSREHWYLKFKEKMEKDGFNVFVPDMPGAYFPKKEEWVEKICSYFPDESWTLIGHSLGGVAILRYLEEDVKKISKAILIATPFEPMNFNPIINFFVPDFNFSKIQNNTKNIIIINSEDDPVVPREHGKKYHQKLESRLIFTNGYYHFNNINIELLENIIKN